MLPRTTLAAVLFSTLGSACVSTVSVDVEDSVEFPNLEVSIPVGGDAAQRVRVRASRAQGEFRQSLDSDERIFIDNTQISGEAEVEGELELEYYSVAIGRDGRLENSGGLRTSLYLGIAQTRFDLSLAEGQRKLETSDDTVELYMQVGFFAEIAKSLDFGLTWAASVGRDFSGINEIDLLLEYRLTENLILSGGYRWFTYEYGLADDDSNIEVDFRGPVLGLNLPF
jgi:hypothetical protein